MYNGFKPDEGDSPADFGLGDDREPGQKGRDRSAVVRVSLVAGAAFDLVYNAVRAVESVKASVGSMRSGFSETVENVFFGTRNHKEESLDSAAE